MWPSSERRCAIRIGWLAEKPSLRAASGWSVEVVKGGGGLRVAGLVSTLSTVKLPSSTAFLAAIACPSAPIVSRSIRSEEHTSELQSLMRISYDVFCLKKKNTVYTI